ncbi:hypothetical protein SPSYN_00893 [Sporotomaculum syntrophicum]|uniref:IrrE N-terminal-like domain-containing protein n=1 Tax=Sporotomaculum syntrophicum TaxID=182264 RepID=A0A9D2WT52_9FIRM|nr:ImmA/IrrE family metallo-endopeptidase [Sporotomaculum syntrophicum]KAF1086152.1 hypothetical protein SPSYN_00893 [Sporotomaculum syntrophicum]
MALYKEARILAKSGKKPSTIARDIGIKILYVPFQKIKGLALSLGNNKMIFINDGLPEAEQEFVCGHELGHFLLHPSTNFLFILQNTFYYGKHEYQANYFSFVLQLGERAEEYSNLISEAASSNDLQRLTRLVWELSEKEDDIP